MVLRTNVVNAFASLGLETVRASRLNVRLTADTDFYLGISQDADFSEARLAYKKLALQHQ